MLQQASCWFSTKSQLITVISSSVLSKVLLCFRLEKHVFVCSANTGLVLLKIKEMRRQMTLTKILHKIQHTRQI